MPGGTPTAAQFAVTGEGTSTFTVSLPASVTLVSGTDNLTVDNFVSTPSATGTLTLALLLLLLEQL